MDNKVCWMLTVVAQGTPQLIQLMPGQTLAPAQLQAAGGVTIPVSVVSHTEQVGRADGVQRGRGLWVWK